MLNLSLALTPIIIIVIFIYFQDKYEKEPIRFLLLTFFLGAISVIPAIVIETAYEELFNFTRGVNLIRTILYSYIGVGLTEEFCKFIVLRWIIYKNKHFNEPMDGVVYAVMVSMGFAAIENTVYVLTSHDPITTAIYRSLTAVPAHASFAVIMGLYVGLARFSVKRKRTKLLTYSIVGSAFAHGTYNVFLFVECYYCPIFTFIALIISIIISLRIISRFKKISPFKKKLQFLKLKNRLVSSEERKRNEERKEELKRRHNL
jgi:RsiW-degrading membrane proteinase PrsW (M82 family)